MASSVAANQVFNTVELLEAILLKLDTATLLISQSVNKTFFTTIACSPSIQKLLYLNPSALLADPKGKRERKHEALVLWDKIVTPEGFNLDIREYQGGDVVFYFNRGLPTVSKPATGSWRRMHISVRVIPGLSQFRARNWTAQRILSFEPQKEQWTLGEVLDALLGPNAKQDRYSY